MVALFFLSVSLGSALSGSLAEYYSPAHEGAYFGILGGIAIVIGVLLSLITPYVRTLMAGVR